MKTSTKRIGIIIATMIVGGVLFYTRYHKWEKATCITPKTCKICGKTEGEALGHTWEPATCEKPKICSACGKTEGEPLGHELSEWKTIEDSTCSKEGIKEAVCRRCNKSIRENIDMLEHTPGEWEVKKNYVISPQALITPGEEVQKCKVCGEELNVREYTIEPSVSQRNAVLKAYSEIQSWHCGRDYLINDILVEIDGFPVEDATFAVDHMKVDWNEQAVLYAKRNGKGESKKNLIDSMSHYGFNQNQIEQGLKAVGY